MKLKIIERLAMGAFVGCFIVLLVMVIGSYANGPQNVFFTGNEIIGAFFGSIIVGWAFSLAGLVYEKEELAFPLQVMIQMLTGMGVLFVVAIFLGWMPVNLGIGPVITWIIIAVIFATVFWLGFYIYYKLLAKELNDKIKNIQ
ncbi:MAG: DUF3021 domain-containing protein [Methanosphaera stadtmanae]|nr:DUF3021 domain-containing protein [Methanosphaera stadtmanae]